MGASATKVVLLCLFLFLGMVLPGILFQPEASVKAWDVNESDFPTNSSSQERLTHLLNYAILAPSSHNSQPWMFKVSENEIMVFADKSRWLKVADADRREQYISIGCALENLVIAAEHFGYNCSVSYFPGPEDLVASVTLHAGTAPRDSRLFHAINSRQTNRNPYRPLSINDADLKAIYSLSSDPEVRIFLTKDSVVKKGFLDLVVQSNAVQYSDVNYKSELGRWLGQGVMGPTGIRAKMAQLAVIFLDVGPEQTRKDAELINSTPYLGFISTANDDRISSIRAGRALQRFWLAATALGISLHPMSQALEVPETKANLTALLSTGSGDMSQVQQAFRLGYAEPVMERSTRRPLEDVLIKE